MRVDSIKNGFVIDHITAGNGMKIYNLLKLGELSCPVALMTNVKSAKMGVKDIIKIDRSPCPLEMSAVKKIDAKNWKTPGNCVFHYSDFWTKKYLERFKNPNLEVYVADHEFPDADVTSYIKLLKQSGIVLYGEEIQEVFADVSDEDFWSAISADVENYDFHDYDARYFASNILILGRILSFRKEKRILSKYEGGIWMIKNVPENLKEALRACKSNVYTVKLSGSSWLFRCTNNTGVYSL